MELIELMVVFYMASLFLWSVFLLGIGLRVLVTRQPLLLSERWYAVLILLGFLPWFMDSVRQTITHPLSPVYYVDPIWQIAVCTFSCIRMRDYEAIGVTNDSFRAAINSVLQHLDTQSDEELPAERASARIHLPSLEADLEVSYRLGVASLRMKPSGAKHFLITIVREMAHYYETTRTRINYAVCVFFVAIGIMIAGLAMLPPEYRFFNPRRDSVTRTAPITATSKAITGKWKWVGGSSRYYEMEFPESQAGQTAGTVHVKAPTKLTTSAGRRIVMGYDLLYVLTDKDMVRIDDPNLDREHHTYRIELANNALTLIESGIGDTFRYERPGEQSGSEDDTPVIEASPPQTPP